MRPTDSQRRIRSLTRARNGFALAAVVVPLALLAVFERQARRLDALADRGVSTHGVVTAVAGGGTYYEYRADGAVYSWNVAYREAPFPAGAVLPVTYLPEVPSFSRPISERRAAGDEAAQCRGFAWRLVLGVGLTLVIFAFGSGRELREARGVAPPAADDPAVVRRRFRVFVLALVPAITVISWHHLGDAMERRESVVGTAFAVLLSLAVVGTALHFFYARGDLATGRARAVAWARWAVPLGIGLALVRLVLALAAG